MITQELLKEALDYNPETGVFIRKKKTNRNIVVGSIAGSIDKEGYVVIKIQGGRHFAHRLAWLYIHGDLLPSSTPIDHINGIKNDNRISNLRAVNHSINGQNIRRSNKNNQTRILGAHWNKRDKVFRSRICVNRQIIYLGTFKTADEAGKAYRAAKKKYHIHVEGIN